MGAACSKAKTVGEGVVARWSLPSAGAREKRVTLAACADEPPSRQPVDHSAWTAVLQAHVRPAEQAAALGAVTGTATVDYAALAADPRFAEYVAHLASAPVAVQTEGWSPYRLSRAEQMALHLNAYNALCAGMAAAGGAKLLSIRDLSTRSSQVWDMPAGSLGGVAISLGEIEHKLLRARWNEPRLHAALVCASASCPNLRREAYDASRLEAQLDAQAAEWLANTTKGAALDMEARRLTLSRIFLWFASDFGGRAGVLEFVARHTEATSAEAAAWIRDNARTVQLEYFEYSWVLNRTHGGDNDN